MRIIWSVIWLIIFVLWGVQVKNDLMPEPRFSSCDKSSYALIELNIMAGCMMPLAFRDIDD